MRRCVPRARRKARPPSPLHYLALLCALGAWCVAGGGSAAGGLLGANLVCARGVTDRQRALCHGAPAAVAALGRGLSMAYAECRVQLAGRRWNCSGVGDDSRLGHVLPLATKEAAFTYAMTSAGATHALGAACARGDLPACSCDHHRRRGWGGPGGGPQWQWGGCGGGGWPARFARRFLDARELEGDARARMNLHNNRVGRKVVKDMVRRECKCHGVSGSCAVRTCWRALPPFPEVAATLRGKYLAARRVTAPAAQPPHLVVRRSRGGVATGGRAPRKSELVYLEPSPAYCEPLPAAAAPGTHGRHCNRSSTGEDGCQSLCCGRGFSTVRLVRRSKCRCQFRWCCSVVCQTCVTATDVHVCN